LPQSAKPILLQILAEASLKPLTLSKTQLVKLLYLTEVEFYRERGERLTDLDWLFYHYGPYALEIDTLLNEKEFEMEKKETKSEREIQLYKIAEPTPKYASFVDAKVSLTVKRIVGEWGNKPLPELLDYVYFETEPMQTVERRGDHLDFSTISRESIPVVIPLKASKETERKVAQLRERFAKRLAEIGAAQREPDPPTPEYVEAMKAWDEEDTFDASGLERMKIIIKPF
jgi:hypothetical protein